LSIWRRKSTIDQLIETEKRELHTMAMTLNQDRQREFISLNVLRHLFDSEYVQKNRIETIKTVRMLTNLGLREAKDFVEDELVPFLMEGKRMVPGVHTGWSPTVRDKTGSIEEVTVSPDEPATLPPPMFLVGHTYKQLDKSVVLILGVSNPNTSYETVYSLGSNGNVIHRYNRRDFGRVTGSSHDTPDPRNLEVI
jgi:hypothetical protein